MKRRLGLGVVVLLGLLSLYSLYYAAFLAWATATPLDAQNLSTAQRGFYVWSALFILSAVSGVVLFFRIGRRR